MKHNLNAMYNTFSEVFPPCSFRLKVSVVASWSQQSRARALNFQKQDHISYRGAQRTKNFSLVRSRLVRPVNRGIVSSPNFPSTPDALRVVGHTLARRSAFSSVALHKATWLAPTLWRTQSIFKRAFAIMQSVSDAIEHESGPTQSGQLRSRTLFSTLVHCVVCCDGGCPRHLCRGKQDTFPTQRVAAIDD